MRWKRIMRMKLKKITAVVLAAALLTANISVAGFADTGAAAGNPDGHLVASPSDANQKSGNESDPDVASPSNANKKVKNESRHRVASPSDADKGPGGEDGSDSDRVAAVVPGKIVLPETLGLDANMKNAFEDLLNWDAYQELGLERNAERFIEQEQYKEEIAGLFPDADKIEVSIEVELKKVVMGDDGYIQYVRYSAAPKVCGYKDGSLLGTKKLDGGYRIGDGDMVQFPIPEQYIAEDAREGSYSIRAGKAPYYGISRDHMYGYLEDNFGEVTIVPSRWSFVDEEYLHISQLAEGKWSTWTGIDNLPKGTSVQVPFDGYPIHEIENPSQEYVDCKMSSDGKSMIITGKKVTDGERKKIYLIRKLKDGPELKLTFRVMVADDPYSGGSSSSSDEDDSYSASSSEPKSSGSWEAGERGWWYRYKDGTYPSNGWNLLEWQGKTSWYYFDAGGYMTSGWLTDADGNRYFLHDKPDGTQGYMYTGWHEIDGKWYYFSEAEGGPLGSLLVNTTTPDGYQVGADGAWIQ